MTMRTLLVFGVLMTLCASASAATGSGAHVGGIDVDHVGQFDPRHWSGYSMYPYDPDCHDFNFRHPDYPWQPSCS
jgi:hypothetical protein